MVLIRSVKALDKFKVELEFSTGERRIVDLEPLLRGPIFEPLRRDPKRFQSARVDEEFGTIVWDKGADMDPDVLYGSHVPAWMEMEKAK
jgi:hypothetical protein